MKANIFTYAGRVVLFAAVVFLAYICVMRVVTPIQFDSTRTNREGAVVEKLVDLRVAVAEYHLQNGRYTADLDSLVLFLQTSTKKELVKEGALTDKQLEAGLNEKKAVKIIETAKKTGKWKEAEEAGLYKDGEILFRRDTVEVNLIESLFKGKYDQESIAEMIYIPYTDKEKFHVALNNNYSTSQGIPVPLIMVYAPYKSYLHDQDAQELVNLEDTKKQLQENQQNTQYDYSVCLHYAGLCFGDSVVANNNAGNWE